MGYRDEDFTWVVRQRLAALVALADAARQVCESDVVDEAALDNLHDKLFDLEKAEGW